MQFNRYHDAKKFYQDTLSVFMRHEAQNTIPLGNVVLGNNGGEAKGWGNTQHWFMATVTDSAANIVLCAIMTPPFPIALYEADNLPNDEALRCLCENLIRENITVPGVMSKHDLAERFAKLYTPMAALSYKVQTHLRIYTLTQVNKSIPLIGTLRKASHKDIYFLPHWHLAFTQDCAMSGFELDRSIASVERAIDKDMMFVLEDEGMPVAIASAVREIINGRSVGMVYTPPYFRKKGYASSCVAQVSQVILDMGYQYVSLFTDLANPISNSIYQKIGYVPVCDCNELHFSPAQPNDER